MATGREAAEADRRANTVALVALVVAGVALLLLTAFVGSRYAAYVDSVKFTTARWRQAPGQRFKIVDDLDKRGLLANATRAQVQSMLGDPNTAEGAVLWYDLGEATTLSIRFGPAGRVAEVYVSSD